MKKILMIVFLWICLYSFSYSQVGIGAGGGLNYPGLTASDVANSKFEIGAGYDIFIRHRLIKLTEEIPLHAKYSVSKYFSDVKLARVGNTRFNFSFLSVELFAPIKTMNSFKIVGGAGLNLINVTAVQKYFESNESLMIPTLLLGAEYWFNKSYNVFGNMNFQFGEFKDNSQNLPVHGFRFQIGATMFFTE